MGDSGTPSGVPQRMSHVGLSGLDHGPLDARSYLKARPRVFGFNGVYKRPLAVYLGTR